MFYGYQTKEEMAEANGDIAELLAASAQRTSATRATSGKTCTGSIDGKTFAYSDGSTDQGQQCVKARAVYDGDTFAWME